MTFLIIVAVAILLFIILFLKSKIKLSDSQKAQFQKLFQSILSQPEIEKQIIQLDSLLCKVLTALGYKGSLGEILKQKPKEVPNIQEIWFAHKLRNSLAHEVGYSLSLKEAQRSIEIFSKIINTLIN